MPDPTRTHWTSDEDLLERYVAGGVALPQRSPLEEHLRSCDLCRARVSDERLMSGGIRSAGRDALRRELADRIAHRPGSSTVGVWRWMAAAAVLVATVGVWRWLTPVTSSLSEPPSVTEQATPAPVDRTSAEQPTTPPETEKPRRPGRSPERRDLVLTPTETRPSIAPAAGAGVATAEVSRDVAADVDVAESAAEPAFLRKTPATVALEAWVEATVIQTGTRELQSLAKREAPARSMDAERVVVATRKGEVQHGPMSVSVQQSPRADLPQLQQVQSATNQTTHVPARLTVVGDSLVVQLYPSTPYPSAALTRAAILRPETDSIVVLIGHRSIGLRIPAHLLVR